MTESTPTFIPCASGNRTQTDFLIRPYGALVEILGHATMHLTPQDARKAALALLGYADTADGLKTPYIATEAFEALLEAAQSLVAKVLWFPTDESGVLEMRVAIADVTALKTALKVFTHDAR